MKVSSWWKSIYLPSGQLSRSSFQRRRHRDQPAAAGFEKLEQRVLLAADWGDAPVGYPTTMTEDGAQHTIVGGAPQLGAAIDSEADGTHSPGADFDDLNGSTPNDEDGLVSLGTMLVGSLDVTVTVNVQVATGQLDAWIDFNGDGSWGGPGEQILDNVPVGTGNTNLTFDVPSWALAGTTYARFRVSTAGDLGVGGLAADGEVEDYQVTILPPAAAGRAFSVQNTISIDAVSARSVFAADVDDDGDMDLLSASRFDNTIAWYENDGSGSFTKQTITTTANGATSVFAADVDGDGDTDVLAALFDVAGNDTIVWYENNGSEIFTKRTISTTAALATSVFAADVDGDGDIDVLSASRLDDKIAWYENDGSENFTQYTISTAADGATSVFAADVDGDGDLDVLSASLLDNKIAWYENFFEVADFDNNLVVDGQDFLILQRGFGTPAPNATESDGDADNDQDVDADDLAVWEAQYGIQFSNAAAPAAAAVAPHADSLRASDVAIIDSNEDESSQPQSPYEFPSATLLVGIAQQAVGTEQSLSESNAAASDEVFSDYSMDEASLPRNSSRPGDTASVSSTSDPPNTREGRHNSDNASAELTPWKDALDEWFARTFS